MTEMWITTIGDFYYLRDDIKSDLVIGMIVGYTLGIKASLVHMRWSMDKNMSLLSVLYNEM